MGALGPKWPRHLSPSSGRGSDSFAGLTRPQPLPEVRPLRLRPHPLPLTNSPGRLPNLFVVSKATPLVSTAGARARGGDSASKRRGLDSRAPLSSRAGGCCCRSHSRSSPRARLSCSGAAAAARSAVLSCSLAAVAPELGCRGAPTARALPPPSSLSSHQAQRARNFSGRDH